MRILYITQTLPFPLHNGGHIKTFSTLKKLKKENHSITICGFITSRFQKKFTTKFGSLGINIGTFVYNHHITGEEGRIKKFFYLLRCIFTPKPFTAYKFFNKEFRTKIFQLIHEQKFDCVWIDHLNMAQYLPDDYKTRKILEIHNIDSLFFKRMAIHDRNYIFKLFAIHEWVKYIIFQKKYFQKFTHIYTISEYDKQQLINITKKNNVKTLPVLLPPISHKILKRKKHVLLFIGSLRWYPNRDGILWFLKNIYPNLKKRIPTLQFWIVGEYSPTTKFPNLPGVKFFNYQKNIAKFYKKSSLFIVPIRYGSGIRIKILEAFSWKTPVISTDIGAEGIPEHIKNQIIISKTKDFYMNVKKFFVTS